MVGRKTARRTEEATGALSKGRGQKVEDYHFEFVDVEELPVNIRSAVSPWHKVVADWMKSDGDAIKLGVSNKIDGRRVANNIRAHAHGKYGEDYNFHTSQVKTIDDNGEEVFYAIVFRTSVEEDRHSEED
jgi:hypothetical protein